MASFQFLSHLIEQYGLYAVFFLVMIEGDITLLLAGVLVDFRRVGKVLLAIVTVVVLLVYLSKRETLSKKVEEVEPETSQHLGQVGIEGLKELKEEIREGIHRQ